MSFRNEQLRNYVYEIVQAHKVFEDSRTIIIIEEPGLGKSLLHLKVGGQFIIKLKKLPLRFLSACR